MATLVFTCLATVVVSAAAETECSGGKRVGTHCVCDVARSCHGTKCTRARSTSRKAGVSSAKARSGYSLSKCADCACVANRAKSPLPKEGPPGTYVPGYDGTYAQNYQVSGVMVEILIRTALTGE